MAREERESWGRSSRRRKVTRTKLVNQLRRWLDIRVTQALHIT